MTFLYTVTFTRALVMTPWWVAGVVTNTGATSAKLPFKRFSSKCVENATNTKCPNTCSAPAMICIVMAAASNSMKNPATKKLYWVITHWNPININCFVISKNTVMPVALLWLTNILRISLQVSNKYTLLLIKFAKNAYKIPSNQKCPHK